MKLADLELGIYDLLAIILPGGMAIFEAVAAIRGFETTWALLTKQSLSSWTLFVGFSFVCGQLISQAAFEAAKLRDKRFHKRTRDKAWQERRERICNSIRSRTGVIIDSPTCEECDRSFNLCLVLSSGKLEKRQNFTAISALMLSLWLLSICGGAIVAGRLLLWRMLQHSWNHVLLAAAECSTFGVACFLSWRRSQLYFHLADTAVFDLAEIIDAAEVEHPTSTVPGATNSIERAE